MASPSNGSAALNAEVVPLQNQQIQRQQHHLMPVIDVATMVQRRDLIVDFTRAIMIEDTDYGTIPGTPKPCLYKPGAEKLVNAFGLTPSIVSKEQDLDWTGERHGGEPFFYFAYTFTMSRDGRVLGVGEGSCNSWESKYRYRWVSDSEVPPHLNRATLQRRDDSMWAFKFAVEKAETSGAYGRPQEYWDKFRDAIQTQTANLVKKQTKGGKTMDAWEIPSVAYRTPNPDVADQVNTIMKMAEKRAYIQAVLMAVGVSEFYTQDLEDIYHGTTTPPATEPNENQPHPPAETTSPTPSPTPTPYVIPKKESSASSAPAAAPTPDPKSKLNAMKDEVFAGLVGVGVEKDACGLILNTYLRAYLDLSPKGAMPKVDYMPAMSALCDHLPGIAAELKTDAAAVGRKMRDLGLPAVSVQWDSLMESLATKRGVTLEQVPEHFDTVGISGRVADEIEAYALLACYTASARLAISDKFTARRVVTELSRKFGALWPLNEAISADLEVALTTLTTSPDSTLLK